MNQMSENQSPENQLTEKQLEAQRTMRRWSPILGIVLLFIGVYISAFLIPDLIQTVGGPTTLTLEESAVVASSERTYARIEGGAWDCDTLREIQGMSATTLRYSLSEQETKYSTIFFTDDAADVVVFVTLSGEVECADLAEKVPTGYLYTLQNDTRQELTASSQLGRYPTTSTLLEFCGYCGQSNSFIGAVFGIVFIILGAGLWIVGRRAKDVKSIQSPTHS